MNELYGTALRLSKNTAQAEDLVAQTYANAWKHFDSFKPGTNIRAWLYRILTNLFLNEARSRKRRGAPQPLENEEGGENFSLYERMSPGIAWMVRNPEDEVLSNLLDRDIHAAVDSLPDPYRVVEVLCDMRGLSYEETARALRLPVSTVRSRLHRARAALQKKLWKHAKDRGLL